jgi:Ca2+-binding RTX toxin-like protein
MELGKSIRSAIVLLPLAIAVLVPAAASATGTMSDYGTFYAAPGDVDNIVVTADGTYVTITDSAGVYASPESLNVGSGDCQVVNANAVKCTRPYYNIDLGDMNDTFSYGGGAFPVSSNFPQQFVVSGGAGSDQINGSPYSDDLDGSSNSSSDPNGNDTVLGNDGNDLITDSDGTANTLDGGPGDDKVEANGTAPASLNGGPGNDFVIGGAGNDVASGGDGDDDVSGGDGADTVLGDAGNDSVEGNPGQDTADGGPGRDSVQDSFHGGCGGPDTLIGGPGPDSFYVACGIPTLKMRDGTADTGECLKAVTTATKDFDPIDKAHGGACQTFIKVCKKKKKGKKASVAKKKKCKRKPYKPPDVQPFSVSLG